MIAHLWQAMWPNMFAPSVFSLAGIGASHWHNLRQHRKTREHIGQGNSGSEAK